jgi:hypothetical protein
VQRAIGRVSIDDAWEVVRGQHPGRRSTDIHQLIDVVVDDPAEGLCIPGASEEVEVEGRVQPVGPHVARESAATDAPGLGDESRRPTGGRRVPVRDPTPGSEELVHVVAVPVRVILHGRPLGLLARTRGTRRREVRQARILAQTVSHVHAHPVDPEVEPEPQDRLELASHVGV